MTTWPEGRNWAVKQVPANNPLGWTVVPHKLFDIKRWALRRIGRFRLIIELEIHP